jgi:hypothetical protein
MGLPLFAETQQGLRLQFFSPPMLFPRNALASGPQAYFSGEKGSGKVRGGKRKIAIDTAFLAKI